MGNWATTYLELASSAEKRANFYQQQMPPSEEESRPSSVAPLLAGAGLGALGAWGLGHTELGHNMGAFMDTQAHNAGAAISHGGEQAQQFIHDHATVPLGQMARGGK